MWLHKMDSLLTCDFGQLVNNRQQLVDIVQVALKTQMSVSLLVQILLFWGMGYIKVLSIDYLSLIL